MSLSRFRFAHAPTAIPQNGSNKDMRRKLVLLCVAAFVTLTWLALFVTNSASAHRLGSHGDEGRIPGLGDFKRHGAATYRFLPSKGEYEVRTLHRPRFFIHMDSAGGEEEPGEATPFAEEGFEGCSSEGCGDLLPTSELAPICRTSGNRIVVVYSHRPSDTSPVPKETLRSIVRRMNWKIADQSSLSSSGVREVRMATDCDKEGNISIYEIKTVNNEWDAILSATVSNTGTGGQLFGAPRGGDAIKYLVFDGKEGAGAVAGREKGIVKSRENPSATYSLPALVPRQAWERHTPIHELFHTLGAVQGDSTPAPPFSGGDKKAHCVDGLDVMCPGEVRCFDSGGFLTPSTYPIDCGKDTYFNAGPKAGTWLAEYWDLAGPEDPFLVTLPTQPPKAETNNATSIRPHTAVLHGTITPKADYAAFYFEYGTTASYGQSAPAPRGVEGFDSSPTPVSAAITGLAQQTSYHYRVVAVNDAGEKSYGDDRAFETVIPSATLCKATEANSLCTTENRYPAGTTIEAEATYQPLSIGTSSPHVDVYCSSTLKAKSTATAGLPLLFMITSWTLSNCESYAEGATCTLTVQKPVEKGSLLWTYDSSQPDEYRDYYGTFTLGGEGNEGLRLKCTGSVEIDCAYEVAPELKVEAIPSYEPHIAVNQFDGNGELDKHSGVCPKESSLEAAYKVISPKPLYVAYGGREPTAVTEAASAIGANSATLGAQVNPQGLATTYHFEYGETTSYGTSVPVPDKSIGSGISDVKVSQAISGLNPSTTYHSRVVASNEIGTTLGKDETFTTCKGSGCSWSTQPTVSPDPTEVKLSGVSCTSATKCMAVGYDKFTERNFAESWNGTAWEIARSNLGTNTPAVSCVPLTSCMIIGSSAGTYGTWRLFQPGEVSGWNTTFYTFAIPSGSTQFELRGISCSSESACTAVGYSYSKETGKYQTLIERFNGSSWSVQMSAEPSEGNGYEALRSVSCSSASACMAVGEAASKPFAERWNGSEWTSASLSGPTDASLEGVSCTSASACMAVGHAGWWEWGVWGVGEREALAESWNGSSWSQVETPQPSEEVWARAASLASVSCLSASSCTAVGGYVIEGEKKGHWHEERTLAETWNGSEWTTQPSPSPDIISTLAGVSCTAASQCTAVGDARPSYFSENNMVTLGERWE
jgi:hypothetical protein